MDLEEARVLFAADGRDAETFAAFRADLEAHGGRAEQILDLSLDLSPAYRKGAREHFPAAQVTFDKFHVMKLLNEAVDQVRRAEQKRRPELKRTRYVWLKNPVRLGAREAALLAQLRPEDVGLKTAAAYQLKLAFQEIWALPAGAARLYLERWLKRAGESGLRPFTRLAKTLRLQREGLLAYFYSRITNGLLEGISSLVQAAKAKARGYRSTRNLKCIIYLLAGKLPLQPLPM